MQWNTDQMVTISISCTSISCTLSRFQVCAPCIVSTCWNLRTTYCGDLNNDRRGCFNQWIVSNQAHRSLKAPALLVWEPFTALLIAPLVKWHQMCLEASPISTSYNRGFRLSRVSEVCRAVRVFVEWWVCICVVVTLCICVVTDSLWYLCNDSHGEGGPVPNTHWRTQPEM